VAGDLVACASDFAYQPRKSLGHLAEKEERRVRPLLAEGVEQPADVGLHPRAPSRHGARVTAQAVRVVVPVLDVDGEYLSGRFHTLRAFHRIVAASEAEAESAQRVKRPL
jgi:hypothetical protein